MAASNLFDTTRLRELLSYTAASAIALGLDVALLSLGLWLGLPMAWAAGLGFASGLFLVYALSVSWVFQQRTVADARLEFLLFLGIGLAGLAMTELLLWALTQRLAWGAAPAKLATTGCVFIFNFSTRKALLFGQRRVNKAQFT